MTFIVNTLLPIILLIGFISYSFKVYYHFLYLKLIKKYPKEWSFISLLYTFNINLIDRFEIILPFIITKKNSDLTYDENRRIGSLKKRIIICLLLFFICFICVVPLGIFLQNKFNIN